MNDFNGLNHGSLVVYAGDNAKNKKLFKGIVGEVDVRVFGTDKVTAKFITENPKAEPEFQKQEHVIMVPSSHLFVVKK